MPDQEIPEIRRRRFNADKNRRFCTGYYSFTLEFPGGVEIRLTMSFVDVRGSTTIAERMNDLEFS